MILPEKRLIAACTVLSLAGIGLLFLISTVTEPPRAALAELAGNGKVTVSGFMKAYSDMGNYAVIELAGTDTIEAISFDAEGVRKLGLKEFQMLEVAGELREFKGRNSIIISRVKAANSSFGCDG